MGHAIAKELPEDAQPPEAEDRKRWPWWKARWCLCVCVVFVHVCRSTDPSITPPSNRTQHPCHTHQQMKKWALCIAVRFFERYGVPRFADEDDPQAQAFAQVRYSGCVWMCGRVGFVGRSMHLIHTHPTPTTHNKHTHQPKQTALLSTHPPTNQTNTTIRPSTPKWRPRCSRPSSSSWRCGPRAAL